MKKKKKGTTINFVGRAAVVPNPDLGAYGIAKAGVIMLTKILAIELAPYNIRVNAIGPGLVKTSGSKYLWGNPQALDSYMSGSLLKRMADPREIADAALYLVSDVASFVTGHVMWIDGGRLVNTR